MAAPTPDPQTGDRFGRLIVKDGVPIRKGREKYFTVLCDCGNSKLVPKCGLTGGRTTSCGCYLKELVTAIRTTHGKSKSPIYAVWNMMKQRCNLPTNLHYADYGGRGIKVSSEWEVFENFYKDMGDPPFKGATIERRDSNQGYCKENVYWATRVEQANNKRNSVRFEFRGEQLSLRQIAGKVGMNFHTLSSRVYNQGLSLGDAVSTPVRTPAECALIRYDGTPYPDRVKGVKLYPTHITTKGKTHV